MRWRNNVGLSSVAVMPAIKRETLLTRRINFLNEELGEDFALSPSSDCPPVPICEYRDGVAGRAIGFGTDDDIFFAVRADHARGCSRCSYLHITLSTRSSCYPDACARTDSCLD